MPGRKSTTSVVSNGPEDETPGPTRAPREGTSVEDLSLPKSMVSRLAKGVLPANTILGKDALLALHKSATVFVNYIASNSNELAQSSGKKTIQPQDVMSCIKDAELEHFLPRLEAELQRYNTIQCDKRNSYRRKVKEEKAAQSANGESKDPSANGDAANADDASANGHDDGEDGEDRPAKKMKRENGDAEAVDLDDADDEEGNGGVDLDDHVDEDEEGEGGEDDDVEDVEEDDGHDETLDETMGEVDERGEERDEALDEPDSD